MLDDDELAFQFARYLDDGRQDHDDRPVLLAGGDRRVECLNDLDTAQEPVKVAQDEERGAFLRGQRADRLDCSQRVRRGNRRARALVSAGNRQSAVNVPGGQRPALLATEPGDLDDSIVVFERLDPDACEAGAARTPTNALRAP